MAMIGSLFAGHEESPGTTVGVEGKRILEPIKGTLTDTLREVQ